MEKTSAFTEKQTPAFVGFRIIEIPLGLVRGMVVEGKGGPGVQRLLDEHPFEDDLTAVAVNESNFSLYLIRNSDGSYKRLAKSQQSETVS